MTQHPVVERYMTHFTHALEAFDFPGLSEVTNEIRNHIAEACAAGSSLDAVLESLGPADELARAYAVELLLNRSSARRLHTAGGFLKIASLVAVTSMVTLVVVGVLGSAGLGFVASGIVIIALGGLEQAGIHLPGVQMAGIAPIVAMAAGLVVLMVGGVALVGLRLYVRFIIRSAKGFRRTTSAVSSAA